MNIDLDHWALLLEARLSKTPREKWAAEIRQFLKSVLCKALLSAGDAAKNFMYRSFCQAVSGKPAYKRKAQQKVFEDAWESSSPKKTHVTPQQTGKLQ